MLTLRPADDRRFIVPALSRRLRLTTLVAATVLGLGSNSVLAQIPVSESRTLGSDATELVEYVRRFNPELAAMVLESEATAARIEAADSLPDPTFRASFEDIDRRSGRLLPERLGSVFYSIAQEFPLWGKRGLRRSIAQADATEARSRTQATAVELTARVKVAFAQYYQASHAIRVTEEIRALLRTVSNIAQTRVAQGIGSQQDAIRAEIEKVALSASLAGLERDRRVAQARMNALLDRQPGAPLAEPRALRPLPPEEALHVDEMIGRALAANPVLAADRARIAGAEDTRKLAEKAWYPDVTLGVTAVDRDRQLSGYEAMVEVKIPLQWDLKKAEISSAAAKLGASRARLQATAAKLRGEIEELFWSLATARRVERLLRDNLLPQVQAAYRSALASYQQARGDLAAVLEADQRVRQVRLDQLKVQTEQQTLLAELERLIGDDL